METYCFDLGNKRKYEIVLVNKMKSELINKTQTIEQFIECYEEYWIKTIDLSPFSIQRTKEQRMINELKYLVKRICGE